MDGIILLLAVAGFLAAARGLTRAGLGLLVRGVDLVMAEEATAIRARSGDLTGLSLADAQSAEARRRRRLSLAAVLLWGAMLAVPPFTPWTRSLYASWSLLWLLPARQR